MDSKEQVSYWLRSSREDLRTADALFSLGRYQHCLFFCHLFVEKMIKAWTVKATGGPAPFSHKLSALAKSARIDLSEDQLDLLDELTAFNIQARYDDYKFQLFKKATRSYTQDYLMKAKGIYTWLKKRL